MRQSIAALAVLLSGIQALGCMSTTTSAREVGRPETRMELGPPLPLAPTVEASVTPVARGFRVTVSRTKTCPVVRRTLAQREIVHESHPNAAVRIGILAAAALSSNDGMKQAGLMYDAMAAHSSTKTRELVTRETTETTHMSPCFAAPVTDAEVVVVSEHGRIAGRTDTQGSVLFVGSEARPVRILIDGERVAKSAHAER